MFIKKDEATNHQFTADESRAIFQLCGGVLDGFIHILSPNASYDQSVLFTYLWPRNRDNWQIDLVCGLGLIRTQF